MSVCVYWHFILNILSLFWFVYEGNCILSFVPELPSFLRPSSASKWRRRRCRSVVVVLERVASFLLLRRFGISPLKVSPKDCLLLVRRCLEFSEYAFVVCLSCAVTFFYSTLLWINLTRERWVSNNAEFPQQSFNYFLKSKYPRDLHDPENRRECEVSGTDDQVETAAQSSFKTILQVTKGHGSCEQLLNQRTKPTSHRTKEQWI